MKNSIFTSRLPYYIKLPFWQKEKSNKAKTNSNFQIVYDHKNQMDLYIHLPYYEASYKCKKNYQIELSYIEKLLKEWKFHLQHFNEKPVLKKLHLSGGRPSLFHHKSLAHLIKNILTTVDLVKDYEFGFDTLPNSTYTAHLETLFELGFRHISISVLDFDDKILALMNRKQSYESIEWLTLKVRSLGFHAVHFALLYGVPCQTKLHIEETIAKILPLCPNQITFYNYVDVPWIRSGQTADSEVDFPFEKTNGKSYEFDRTLLKTCGYCEMERDHFELLQQKGSNIIYKSNYTTWEILKKTK